MRKDSQYVDRHAYRSGHAQFIHRRLEQDGCFCLRAKSLHHGRVSLSRFVVPIRKETGIEKGLGLNTPRVKVEAHGAKALPGPRMSRTKRGGSSFEKFSPATGWWSIQHAAYVRVHT